MTLSRFLKLVQLLASLNTLKSLTPLNAEKAPPVEISEAPATSLYVSTRAISTMDKITIAASNKLNPSFEYSFMPRPSNLIIISAKKQYVKNVFANSN